MSRVFGQTWAIACAICVIGGILIGMISFAESTITLTGLKIIPVVLCGGLQSVAGVAILGPVIGIIESFSAEYISPIVGGAFEEIAAYILLLIVLTIKPTGLFGWKRIERI